MKEKDCEEIEGEERVKMEKGTGAYEKEVEEEYKERKKERTTSMPSEQWQHCTHLGNLANSNTSSKGAELCNH